MPPRPTPSAVRARRRRGSASQGLAIAAFLLREPLLPRSVLGCLDRAAATLGRIRDEGEPSLGAEAATHLDGLRARLRDRPIEAMVEGGIHAELTHLIDAMSVVAGLIERAYFEPDAEAQRALIA
ncbi:MAG: alpha-E domain-containing protein [Myxococcota bacterium]